MVDAVFNQADVNKDQRLDFNEFRNLIAQSLGTGAASFAGSNTGVNQYAAGSFESAGHGGYGDVNGANGSYSNNGANGSYSNNGANGSYGSNGALGGGLNEAGFTGDAAGASASTFEATTSSSQVQGGYGAASGTANAGANSQNLYQDPNPQIIRRPAQGGPVTYTQNVKIRFLQPPPIAPPGPLIIKEVRPPQPPPPPPLRVRQQAPPCPQPPPLILREKPPAPPTNMGSQTVVRRLPAIPVPPRSVIIERLPALPPKPRDIIIERWMPYTTTAKRKTIVQRAEPPKEYPKPRNIIIQYEPVQVRVVRQFQRLGVTQESPAAYVQRYGTTLLEAQTLVQQARAAGVVEDISPPKTGPSPTGSSVSVNGDYGSAGSGVGLTNGADLANGTTDLTSGVDVNGCIEQSAVSGEYTGNGGEYGGESADFSAGGFDYSGTGDVAAAASPAHSLNRSRSGSQHRNASFSAFETTQANGLAENGYGSSFARGSVASQGARLTSPGADFGGASASAYESYNTSASGLNVDDQDPATIAFNEADLNKDGTLDPNEFRQFLSAQFQSRA